MSDKVDTRQEWLDQTHILDVWLKEKLGWECVNWCIITENNELFIWLDSKVNPTYFQLKELSNFLLTENIVLDTVICNPCGYSLLDNIENEDELQEFSFITLKINNWSFSKLSSFFVKKQLEENDFSDNFSDKLLKKEGLL